MRRLDLIELQNGYESQEIIRADTSLHMTVLEFSAFTLTWIATFFILNFGDSKTNS